ncbi:PrsW family intramembrane metalloprotease [Thermococcus argininiproducens]|uniref:Protease PrsW n=1 Tax=Thermococcus argininiproducens TaxID=2866384 RepID=A0A9E7M8K9_9EURY|nr:PrsW family intramembrane metalloprotease [Thermococcus argininiproducens]USG99431.1 PrsW family intramembrane metalloprotease [Thermococcus argininiproducens]
MDIFSTIVFFAYAPALGLLWYFYHEDKYEPEPKRFVIATFLLGATLSVGVAMVLEAFLVEGEFGYALLPATAFSMALIAGIVEEPAKALAIRLPFKAGQMDGIMDGVVYGVAAGLGFAATENFLYGIGFGVGATIVRGFLTPFAHATWSAIIGVGYGLKAEGKLQTLSSYFALAILLHFLWDYFAFLSITIPSYYIFTILLIFINIALVRYFIILGQQEDLEKVWWYWFVGGKET